MSLVVRGVAPWSGPVLGGTVVTIAGSRLAQAADAEALRCQFGGVMDASSVASAHGSDGVRCLSPSALPTGWSSVELTMHGTALRSGGSVYVHAAVYASAVVPPAGPVAGGTRVSVFGAGFREVATLRCRFEGSGATSAARRVSAGQLECASPPSSAAGARRLALSANGQQFAHSDGIFFTYRPSAAVSSVWPPSGAAEGGTPVTVLGSGFSSAAEASGSLRCRFNATSVAAAYVSESVVACNSTASSAGHAVVEVSTNGREYTSSGVHFELVSLVVHGLAPWSGPALGGTVVTIAGSRLAEAADAEALRCRFGGVMDASSVASAHGSDGVRCVSPSALPTGWSSVELTMHLSLIHI